MPLDIPLRAKLAAKEPASGAWLTLNSTAVAKTIASTPGISWVLVDGEHGLISDIHYFDLCNTIAASGASPIIRIPSDETWLIKRALDAGAHGIMIPMANSPELVRNVVKSCKYPPTGIRGFGPMFTHATGKLGLEYKNAADQDLVIMVQIEHPDAVREIDAIVAEGVDVAFIGPFDLAVSMNVPFGQEEHEGAITKIRESAKAAGKTSAIFCLTGEQAEKRYAQGFDMVSVTTDIDTLAGGIAKEVNNAIGSQAAKQGGYA